MPRTLLFTAMISLCAGPLNARIAPVTKEEKPAAPRESRPRRVLFRTTVQPTFAPAPPKPVAPEIPAERRERGRSIARATPIAPAVPAPPPKARRIEPAETASVSNPSARRDLDLQPTSFTPYDRYLGSVRSVLTALDQREATMTDACELVRTGRRFRYLATDPYRAQSPNVTSAQRAGDCKSKALWLYDHLGDPSAYFVIGKLERRSRTSHAWVYWRHDDRWWILDPTDRSAPVAADSVSSSRYVPYYSYSKEGSFRHSATRLMLAMNTLARDTMAVQARPANAPRGSRR